MTGNGSNWLVYCVVVLLGVLAGGCGDDSSGAADAAPMDAAPLDAAPLDAALSDASADVQTSDPTELGYDDGTNDQSSSPWGVAAGAMIAVRFTPPSYPVRLQSARFYVAQGGIPQTAFRVRVFLADGNHSVPNTDLLTEDATGMASWPNTWVDVDLSAYNITIDDGGFYIAMEWTTPAGDYGVNAQFLGNDLSDPDSRTLWFWTELGEWLPVDQAVQGADRDAMIRAVVEY